MRHKNKYIIGSLIHVTEKINPKMFQEKLNNIVEEILPNFLGGRQPRAWNKKHQLHGNICRFYNFAVVTCKKYFLTNSAYPHRFFYEMKCSVFLKV